MAAAAAVALLAANGCSADGGGIAPEVCAAPLLATSVAVANPSNVLGAFVSTGVQGADSIAVRFGTASTAGWALDSATPTLRLSVPAEPVLLVPVFGLRPATEYALQVVAFNRCATTQSDPLRFTSGPLPEDLPSFSAGGSDPVPGYVVFSARGYGLAIDNTGRVVWYHRLADGAALAFQPQPNGRYASRPSGVVEGEPVVWREVDPLGGRTRSLGCARGLPARPHDLLAQPDGSYWLMCDETRVLNLSAEGGPAAARVTGTVVQHVGATGALRFEWSAFEHLEFRYADVDSADRNGDRVNWTHGNAIDVDDEGQLYLSLRNLSQVLKIDTRSGRVIWRMGGERSDLAFEGVAPPAFARQHGVRVTGANRLLLLDNLGDSSGSRGELYEIDEARQVVRLVQSVGPEDAVVARLGGSTQGLGAGRSLISFGNGGRVEEYDASGTMVWRIHGNPGYVFRAQRIRSLYAPGGAAGFTR